MSSPRAYSDAQKLISNYSHAVVEYLKSVCTVYHYIGDAFDSDKMLGRLFCQIKGLTLSNELQELFQSDILIASFAARKNRLPITSDDASIQQVRSEFIDYYFGMLEASPEWEAFLVLLQKQVFDFREYKQAKNDANDFQHSTEIKRLRDLIAGAFVYKITLAFLQKHPEMTQELKLFSSIVSMVGDKRQIKESDEEKFQRYIHDQLLSFKMDVSSGEISKSHLCEKLQKLIDAIRISSEFGRRDNAAQKLYLALSHMFDDLISLQLNDYKLKKIAEAILCDILTHYVNRETHEVNQPPVSVIALVSKLKRYMHSDGKAAHRCAKLLAWHAQYEAAQVKHAQLLLPIGSVALFGSPQNSPRTPRSPSPEPSPRGRAVNK